MIKLVATGTFGCSPVGTEKLGLPQHIQEVTQDFERKSCRCFTGIWTYGNGRSSK